MFFSFVFSRKTTSNWHYDALLLPLAPKYSSIASLIFFEYNIYTYINALLQCNRHVLCFPHHSHTNEKNITTSILNRLSLVETSRFR